MDKNYDHLKFEKDIYKMWEKSGSFSPSESYTGDNFCIIMPPPNANDNLHIGHARFVTIEDILIRYHRMLGDSTLWLPGADHAGIETQFLFEKKLKEQGKSRFDFQPEVLFEMIWKYVDENKANMQNQLKSLGASCDWTRIKFTLDPEVVKIVYKTFKKLSDDKLLYRGEKLVNYCTKCGTAYSELEVDHTEKDGEFYTLDYGTVKVATTRPETIFADSAIAVNPKDPKLKSLIGKTATIPLIDRDIPIIADEAVEIGFGTGALKVTPSHDFIDWEIGLRHNLNKIQIISTEGKMISPAPDEIVGLYVNQARKLTIELLEKAGKLVESTNKKIIASVCYKCGTTIEPLPVLQWFIKVKELSNSALKAVENKETIFTSEKFEKIYNHWLLNLKDWNISRQIVWGIRIPAWKCKSCNEWTITNGETPVKCVKCDSSEIIQDKDTFDTWFSSGQWPFATLKTTFPEDFEKYYPTSVMETAYDILPFWVMRMMMLGIYATGKVPFKKVLIHGLVRDKFGKKISKSKGNTINPLEMSDKYGTDSLRNSLIWGTLVDNDIALSEENIKGQKNFANKIWNAARFVSSLEDNKVTTSDPIYQKELNNIISKVTDYLNKFELSYAVEFLYEKFWHWFCDVCIENAKLNKLSKAELVQGLLIFLKLLHPFMPFVTEAIWQELRKSGIGNIQEEFLISSKWPTV